MQKCNEKSCATAVEMSVRIHMPDNGTETTLVFVDDLNPYRNSRGESNGWEKVGSIDYQCDRKKIHLLLNRLYYMYMRYLGREKAMEDNGCCGVHMCYACDYNWHGICLVCPL